MSTQERIDVRARDGYSDPGPSRVGSAPGQGARSSTDRLPRPPGRRRPGLAVLAVLLIVLGAAVAGLLALRLDDRVEVLVARHNISMGQQIEVSDLQFARVSADGVSLIRAAQASTIIGRYAGQPIARGRLLDPAMFSTSGLLTAGRAEVGIALPPGRLPAGGLTTGDTVQVVRAVNGEGRVLSARAVVSDIREPKDSGFGASGNGQTVVSVVVGDQEAATVAAAAMADQVSLVLLGAASSSGAG